LGFWDFGFVWDLGRRYGLLVEGSKPLSRLVEPPLESIRMREGGEDIGRKHRHEQGRQSPSSPFGFLRLPTQGGRGTDTHGDRDKRQRDEGIRKGLSIQ
jgi:hypothetical protein